MLFVFVWTCRLIRSCRLDLMVVLVLLFGFDGCLDLLVLLALLFGFAGRVGLYVSICRSCCLD